MEQKRVLWIVAAVGLFLLVVIGTALILYSPTQQNKSTFTNLQATSDFYAKDGYTEANKDTENKTVLIDNNQTQRPVSENDTTAQNKLSITETSKDSQLMQTNNNNSTMQVGQQNQIASSTNNTQSNIGASQITIDGKTVTVIAENANVYTQKTTTIDLQPITDKKVATETSSKTSNVAKTNTSSVSASKSSDSTSNTTTAKKSTATTTAKTTTSVKTAPTKLPDQFWVQVASFTGKKNAEEAREALSTEKISSEIFTYKDAKGTIFYRLRVGPYTTKSEAEYWNSRIKLIDQFTGTSSYVVNSTASAQN